MEHRLTITADIQTALQNAVAISAELHSDRRYSQFYDCVCRAGVNGFIGIYDLCISMAERLSAFELNQQDGWEEYDWIMLVGAYSNSVIECGLDASNHGFFMPDLDALLEHAVAASAHDCEQLNHSQSNPD